MDIPLGKSVQQPKCFSPEILAGVPRAASRKSANIRVEAFTGLDRWTAYEFIWFDAQGKSNVALLDIQVDSQSKNIVESKSLKLFLNSCYYRDFESKAAVEAELTDQLKNIVAGAVEIQLLSPEQAEIKLLPLAAPGVSIDRLNTDNKRELQSESGEVVHQRLRSDLFRSLCPVTGQPDWATILIEYRGTKLDQSALLGYLKEYAEHSSFHEACVESIFQDIQTLQGIEDVAVCAKFLRRGGIDICPFRTSTPNFLEPKGRMIRQ